jgi:hypothetical protein
MISQSHGVFPMGVCRIHPRDVLPENHKEEQKDPHGFLLCFLLNLRVRSLGGVCGWGHRVCSPYRTKRKSRTRWGSLERMV